MQITFSIFVALLLAISVWEYTTGKVLDIVFSGILTRRQEAKGALLKLIAAQLFVWIFLLLLFFLTYAVIFKAHDVDVRRIRAYLLIIFVLVVFPVAMVRKKFALWVKKTVVSKKES
jgi:hypothetical protein